MKQIHVQPLSAEAFRRYGVFQNLLDDASLAATSIFDAGFFADVLALDFGPGNLPTVSVCPVHPQEKKIIRFLEAHGTTSEGLLPIDQDVVIYVGVPGKGPERLTTDTLEAFYVPRGTFVKLNPLITHGPQYSVCDAEAHVLCLLPGRTFHNDMIMKRLNEDEWVEIVD